MRGEDNPDSGPRFAENTLRVTPRRRSLWLEVGRPEPIACVAYTPAVFCSPELRLLFSCSLYFNQFSSLLSLSPVPTVWNFTTLRYFSKCLPPVLCHRPMINHAISQPSITGQYEHASLQLFPLGVGTTETRFTNKTCPVRESGGAFIRADILLIVDRSGLDDGGPIVISGVYPFMTERIRFLTFTN